MNARQNLGIGVTAWLILLAAIVLGQRLYTVEEPLNRDITGYALIGHGELHGRSLYSDLWERKPPLLYATFAAAELCVGFGPREVLLVNMLAAWATLGAVFVLGRRGGGNAGGVLAATLWAIVSADLPMEANQPNAEVFINSALAWAAVLLMWWPTQCRLRRAAAVGALLAAATSYKHHVAVVAAALLAAHIAASRPRWRRSIAEASVAGGVIVVTWLAMFAYFGFIGHLPATIDVLFGANAAYAGSVSDNLRAAISERQRLFPSFMGWAIQPLLLIVLGLLVRTIAFFLTPRPVLRERDGVRVIPERMAGLDVQNHPHPHPEYWETGPDEWIARRWDDRVLNRPVIIWIAWVCATWLAVAVPGRLYAHYYQFWMPVICVAAGWAGATLLAQPGRWLRWAAVSAIAEVVLATMMREGRYFVLSPTQWAQEKYVGDNLPEEKALGQQLRVSLGPGQRMWVLGEDNPIYFYARQDPPSGLLYLQPLVANGGTPAAWDRLMNDLRRAPPTIILLNRFYLQFVPPDAPVFAWLKQNYQPLATSLGRPSYVTLVRHETVRFPSVGPTD